MNPEQFGIYRRTYTDADRNSVCCYVAINKSPFLRLGTTCFLEESREKYDSLRDFGLNFRKTLTANIGFRGNLPSYYSKPFELDPDIIRGNDLLNNSSDKILLLTMVLDDRPIQIRKTNLDPKESRAFEEGFMSDMMY